MEFRSVWDDRRHRDGNRFCLTLAGRKGESTTDETSSLTVHGPTVANHCFAKMSVEPTKVAGSSVPLGFGEISQHSLGEVTPCASLLRYLQ